MKDITETRNTARYFTENRNIAWVLLIGLFLWGIYGYLAMPKAKDPAIEVRVASVITSWPGADAAKIEQLVTRPIERQIALSSTLHPVTPTKFAIKSMTLPSLSIVQIQLDEDISDTKSAFNEINLNLQALQLPAGAGPIQFNDGFGDTAAILLTIASPTESEVEISLRARDIRRGIDAAREGHSAAGENRRSLVVVLPRDIALSPLRRNMELLRNYLLDSALIDDPVPLTGAGFIGLDFTAHASDGEILAALGRFLETKLGQVSFHEDAWPALIIDNPADTEAHLLASPGGKYSYRELDNFSNLIIRNLQTVPLVTVINTSGTVDERIYLEYSQDLLASYGLTPGDVNSAIAARNSDISGGEMYVGGMNVQVEPTGKYKSWDEIGDTAFTRSSSGAPVYLRDIGDVVPGYVSPPTFLNYYNWRDENGKWHRGKAISLAIQMRDGGQIGKFGEAVDEVLREVRPHLPDDLVIDRISDQPSQVAENIDLFMTALYEAIILVVVISFLGFWEWRSALLMMLSIPITLAMTFGVIYMLGIELQQVSIATLIIALGLLVDDPVVAGDAIKRGLAEGQPRSLASWLGPTKLAHAIMFATITNVVAYLPFLLLSGNTGEFLYSLPIVMTAALVNSRIVSMTFLPMLGYYLLRPHKKPERTIEERRSRGFSGYYYRLGGFLIDHRKKALLISLLFIALAIPLGKTLKSSFFPDDVQYIFYADVSLRNNATIYETRKVTEQAVAIVQEVARDFGERYNAERGGDPLLSIASFIGGGAPRFWFSVTPQLHQHNYAQLIMQVNNKEITGEIIPHIQRALSSRIPEAIIDVRQLQTNPVPYPVELRLSARSAVESEGPESEAEIATLRRLSAELVEILAKSPHATRPRDDWGNEVLRLKIEIDADRAFLAGVSNENIAASSSAGMNGNVVTMLQRGDKNIPVVTILTPRERAQLSDLENLYVFPAVGTTMVPLGQIATVKYQLHTERILREEHFRSVNVRAFPLNGILPSEVMADIRSDLEAFEKRLPPGFTLKITGEEANAKNGFQQLVGVMAVSVALIFIALVFQFKSTVKPLVVLAAVPYGVIGALIALVATGSPFGFMAFLGIVALIGVIVSHIIVLFDFIEEMHHKGEPLREALLDAGIVRLRPVLITVGATIFGLIPLAVHGGPLWQPLCYAQIGGLTVATFTTLLLVPVIYAIFVLDLKIVRWEEKEPSLAAANA